MELDRGRRCYHCRPLVYWRTQCNCIHRRHVILQKGAPGEGSAPPRQPGLVTPSFVVIVDDRSVSCWAVDERVTAVTAQVDGEVLARLLLRVTIDRDRDLLAGLARCEGKRRQSLAQVVVVRGRRAPI